MQKLPVRQRLLLGFTLFSMFFGAGNLIFPPHLGAQAGSNFWPAFAGFAVSAIGLPVAGVVAVARAGGFDQLASRVHPKFSLVFTILVYLSIGPCLAIPRTASTSFEMLVPLVGGGRGLQLGYSTVFFAAAFLVALHPEKLTDRLGRVLCPALIALIFVLFAFIPVSEDDGMIHAAECGCLTIEKLEAMTAVCSVGIDMVIIPGDTTPAVISALIADEAAIGMVNSKTTAVRVIPAIGRKAGEILDFGGLLGYGPIMPVNQRDPSVFINRGGRLPAPMQSLKN